ncbi:MAG: EscU/YscU/HrcU family type III secretion system export apparatus switch protein [Angelakisella sp.]|nr:EscU/YscU/HrcU family type III secretion system export apparatus switch protein [Angelakisella sp.]
MSKSKKNKAVALKYNQEEDASPVVIASGYGSIADKIIDIAEQKGIPVFRDDSAASLMCMLEVGSNIPTELYAVIAAIYCQLLQTSTEIKSQQNDSETSKSDILASSRIKRISKTTQETPSSNQPDNHKHL